MRTYWKNSDRLILWFAAHYPERVALPEAVLENIGNGTLLDYIELWQESPKGLEERRKFIRECLEFCRNGRTSP
jgi:hypothetical protein